MPDDGVAEALKRIASEVLKEYDGLIKAIWIYGSAVRKGEFKPTSDIDMLILLDDITQKATAAKLSEVDDVATGIAKAVKKEMNINIHVQPPKRLSDWWDLLRGGEPFAFTCMRDALPIYDPSGYIEPMRRLLRSGQVHGTWERAQMLLERAPYRLETAKRIFHSEITADLLLAMVESGQAVLMFSGAAPATAPTLGVELRRHFVERKLLEPGYVDMYEDFYEFTKKFEHGEMTKISGKEMDRWIKRAKAFLIRMQELFDVLEALKKKEIIEEAHKESLDAARAALAKVGKKPAT
ncbi:MAG: nucleotidyltransferase domain-containing protein, partial [Candidatus Aenigmatarchaeota archaeon]